MKNVCVCVFRDKDRQTDRKKRKIEILLEDGRGGFETYDKVLIYFPILVTLYYFHFSPIHEVKVKRYYNIQIQYIKFRSKDTSVITLEYSTYDISVFLYAILL